MVTIRNIFAYFATAFIPIHIMKLRQVCFIFLGNFLSVHMVWIINKLYLFLLQTHNCTNLCPIYHKRH